MIGQICKCLDSNCLDITSISMNMNRKRFYRFGVEKDLHYGNKYHNFEKIVML